MGLPQPTSDDLFTVEEYLKFERAAEERHEYFDGKIYAMAGESPEHGDVTANITGSMVTQLRGRPCRARFKDTKVRSGPGLQSRRNVAGMFSYPDMVVICGEPEYHDHHKDVVTNPKVIIEVLSPSTEAFDRDEKFDHYQSWNPTLTDYLLVSQDQPRIEHFERQADGSWKYTRVKGLDAEAAIPSIECTLKLTDVYDRVEFPKPKKAKKRRTPRKR